MSKTMLHIWNKTLKLPEKNIIIIFFCLGIRVHLSSAKRSFCGVYFLCPNSSISHSEHSLFSVLQGKKSLNLRKKKQFKKMRKVFSSAFGVHILFQETPWNNNKNFPNINHESKNSSHHRLARIYLHNLW